MRTIHTALLSFGMSGTVFHAPFINLHQGFRLAGSWERSKKMIESAYPGTCSYASLDAVLNDDSVELVIVNTPTYTHYDYAKQALAAGKHVVVEKAFTSTVVEAEELKKLAEKQDKKLAVYQNRRWDSDFLTVKKVIESGKLGELTEMEIHFDRYNLDLSYKTHKEEPNSGSGIVKDLGPHAIDQALFLFGMPQAVFADIRTIRPVSIVDDCFDILLYYPTLHVRVKATLIAKESVPAYIVHGTNGSFLKSRADIQERVLLQGAKPGTKDWGTEPVSEQGIISYLENGQTIRKKIESEQGNYLEFYNEVYTALTEDKAMPVTADDGIRVMRIIEAAFKSQKDRKLIVL
ncbi:MAG: oxidoreductase [Bacteroidetes bacterium]|nr:oxidoreductase [Bacteroidota bacterium]